MITASEAIFIALMSLFPPETGSEMHGSIYARPEDDHYKITYIHPGAIRAAAPNVLAIETHQLDIDKETGRAGKVSVYIHNKLEGLKPPYAHRDGADTRISLHDMLKNALAAIPDKTTYDEYGTLQIVRNKDNYEVIFPPRETLEPGDRGDDFAFIIHLNADGEISKITAPR